MLTAFGARIRKVKPPYARGLYRVEIAGNYRYCNNIQRHHNKNQVYFLVDPVKKIYYQKCYDPDCQGFQSAKQPIYTNQTTNNQQVHNSTSEYLILCLNQTILFCDFRYVIVKISVFANVFNNQEN
jgi:hypothetical protein